MISLTGTETGTGNRNRGWDWDWKQDWTGTGPELKLGSGLIYYIDNVGWGQLKYYGIKNLGIQ